MYSMFLRYLVLKLNQFDSQWRSNSILVMDGASYHIASSTRDLMKKLNLPVIILGPYSYDLNPVELFFAAFKSDDVNLRKVPTSKKHFETVVKLVIERIKLIPKH